MEEEFIDIADTKAQFELRRRRFQENQSISERNRELVLSFVRDAQLGKTILARAKKRVGCSRLHRYFNHLEKLIDFVGTDLDAVAQTDMEQFIETLDNGLIRSKMQYAVGCQRRAMRDCALSERHKVDIKFTVRKFYKWLLGENRVYPKLVEWINTYWKPPPMPALTEREVSRMLDHCVNARKRALIQVLFDGGFRLGELLNVRLRHVQLKLVDAQRQTRCFFIHVPFSKTNPRTIALPMSATKNGLSIWLEKHPGRPLIRADGTLETANFAEQPFPMTATAARIIFRNIARKALDKRVYPHLMRHTSATCWSNSLSHFQLCKRFAWDLTSDMPRQYVDRQGIDEMEVVRIQMAADAERRTRESQDPNAYLADLTVDAAEGQQRPIETASSRPIDGEFAASPERWTPARPRRRTRESGRFI